MNTQTSDIIIAIFGGLITLVLFARFFLGILALPTCPYAPGTQEKKQNDIKIIRSLIYSAITFVLTREYVNYAFFLNEADGGTFDKTKAMLMIAVFAALIIGVIITSKEMISLFPFVIDSTLKKKIRMKYEIMFYVAGFLFAVLLFGGPRIIEMLI